MADRLETMSSDHKEAMKKLPRIMQTSAKAWLVHFLYYNSQWSNTSYMPPYYHQCPNLCSPTIASYLVRFTRLKAFLPRMNSGRAGIVDLNPYKEYVKPFNLEINATHEERCCYKADRSMWSRWRLIGFAQCFMDAFPSFWRTCEFL